MSQEPNDTTVPFGQSLRRYGQIIHPTPGMVRDPHNLCQNVHLAPPYTILNCALTRIKSQHQQLANPALKARMI